MQGGRAGILFFGWSLACGPVVDEPMSGDSDGVGERAPLEQAVYSPFPLAGPALVCIPVDDGCLRLKIDVPQARVEAVIEGELVGPDCHASDDPLAIVETFHGHVSTGHGALFILGDLAFDDGTDLAFDVQAVPADAIEGAECD